MAALGRSLSGLTQAERRLLCVIAALALLGLGVKWWARHVPDPPSSPTLRWLLPRKTL